MGIEEDTLGMNGRNEKRGGLSDGKRMYVGKEKVFLHGDRRAVEIDLDVNKVRRAKRRE